LFAIYTKVKYELIQSFEGIMPMVKNVKTNRVCEIGLLHFSNRYYCRV